MEVLVALIGLLIGLATLALLGGVVVGLGIWVFRPLDTAAKGQRRPTQFTIVDFLCLFVVIQVPTALIHSKAMAGAGAAVYVLDAFVWTACGLLWWKSVEVMSRAGIRRTWHRIVFLTVVFPVTLVAGFAVPVLPFAFLASLGNSSTTAPLIIEGIGVATAAGLAFSAFFTRRMVAAVAPPEPESGDVETPPPTIGSGDPH